MNDSPPTAANDERQADPEGTSVVMVKQSNVQAVIDFLADLQRDDDEVVGHMIPLRSTSTSSTSGTGCVQTTTGNLGTDLKCNDSDQMPI